MLEDAPDPLALAVALLETRSWPATGVPVTGDPAKGDPANGDPANGDPGADDLATGDAEIFSAFADAVRPACKPEGADLRVSHVVMRLEDNPAILAMLLLIGLPMAEAPRSDGAFDKPIARFLQRVSSAHGRLSAIAELKSIEHLLSMRNADLRAILFGREQEQRRKSRPRGKG